MRQRIAELGKKGASDLHLEPGLPMTARIQGQLIPLEKQPLTAGETRKIAREILSDKDWALFTANQAVDLSIHLGKVQCRVHVLKTFRGVGLAIRLLSSFLPTLERLNLHPDLGKLARKRHGLLVVSGPTGSGKSSTVAALINEINTRENRHIVTVESPIEYFVPPKCSFVRQREVGRDTPSFERALLDAMREDPDVIVVGEMREPETIRLTLNAAETGHLVLTTLHSATTAEAVRRIVSAFPSEIQNSVCSQLADSLIGVAAQRLTYNERHGIRVPLLEIMIATHPVKNLIRQGQFFKLGSILETGHGDGNWTLDRYQRWLDARDDFFVPDDSESLEIVPGRVKPLLKDGESRSFESTELETAAGTPGDIDQQGLGEDADVIVIDEPEEESLGDLLKKIDKPKGPDGSSV